MHILALQVQAALSSFPKLKTSYVLLYWPNPTRIGIQQPSPRPPWTHPEMWAPLAKSVANERIPDLRARQGDRGERFIQEGRRRGKASGLTTRPCYARTEKGQRRGQGYRSRQGTIKQRKRKKKVNTRGVEKGASATRLYNSSCSIVFPRRHMVGPATAVAPACVSHKIRSDLL